ncbi:hypothetical protein [Roseateles sp. P5_E7]
MNPFDAHRAGDHAPSRLVELLALGALLALAWRACGARHHRRRLARSARAPEEVQTWEGEGGRPLPAEHAASTVSPSARMP